LLVTLGFSLNLFSDASALSPEGGTTLGMLDIIDPTSTGPAYAGPHDAPHKIILRLTKPTTGLDRNNFTVMIGGGTATLGLPASVVTLYEGTDEYVLEVLPPIMGANGLYDLQVSVLIGSAALADFEQDAVLYDDSNNVDVMLIVDRSGSMDYGYYGPFSYMESAKNAAKLFVDFMRDGDKLGVVSFNNEVDVPYPLEIVNSASKDAARQAIDDLKPRGWTSIGGGMQAGENQLQSYGTLVHPWAMVLLSDGQENRAPWVADVLPDIAATKTVVHTIALGEYSDEALMLDIAAQTGGTYNMVPSGDQLQGVYNTIAATVTGQQTLLSSTGIVQDGQTDEKEVVVDSTVAEATFSVSWSSSANTLELTLQDPNGAVIDAAVALSNTDVSYVTGSTYAYYRVHTPTLITGTWKMTVTGGYIPLYRVPFVAPAAEESYTAMVTGGAEGAGLTLRAYLDQTSYLANDPIKLSVTLSDEQLITDAEVTAMVGPLVTVGPATRAPVLVLYDDGLHGDGLANNGVYANTLDGSNTTNEGAYNFQVFATGLSNSGETFTRQVQRNVNVGLVSTDPGQEFYYCYLSLITGP
jgi:hypothetical protein